MPRCKFLSRYQLVFLAYFLEYQKTFQGRAMQELLTKIKMYWMKGQKWYSSFATTTNTYQININKDITCNGTTLRYMIHYWIIYQIQYSKYTICSLYSIYFSVIRDLYFIYILSVNAFEKAERSESLRKYKDQRIMHLDDLCQQLEYVYHSLWIIKFLFV